MGLDMEVAGVSNTFTPSFIQSVMTQSAGNERNALQRHRNDDSSSDNQIPDIPIPRRGEGRHGWKRPASRRTDECNDETVSGHRSERNRLLAEVKKSFDELQ